MYFEIQYNIMYHFNAMHCNNVATVLDFKRNAHIKFYRFFMNECGTGGSPPTKKSHPVQIMPTKPLYWITTM